MVMDKYIYVTPYEDGRWQVFGSAEQEFTAELFATRKQAIRYVPQYAKALGWPRSEYTLSIDE